MADATRHGVWLYDRPVGWLYHHDNYCWFEFRGDYLSDPARPVLGLRFEERPRDRFAANMRLPQWFSNLLPEGTLREFIAAERSVSPQREMELIAQIGHDLPGAVRVLPDGYHTVPDVAQVLESASMSATPEGNLHSRFKFSLAGVGLKFSMIRTGSRFVCSATGEGGDWIVKMPEVAFSSVPHNEYAMMRFAGAVGIEVPEVSLVHRDNIEGVPDRLWPQGEDFAYAVRRFDRDAQRKLVHIEDFAQLRGVYPTQKYEGNFETVAALAYRRHDIAALREFARRLTFFVLVGNGDAHMKNWSLIYRDRRIPTLSPAYDIVSTEPYNIDVVPDNLGLRFAGDRRFESVRVAQFERLERRLTADADLGSVVTETVDRVRSEWPAFSDELSGFPSIRDSVTAAIATRSKTLLRSR